MSRNRGELAEGWYEPETLRKAQASAVLASRTAAKMQMQDARSVDLSDDDVGPALPGGSKMVSHAGSERRGPAIPSLQDLELQRGMRAFTYYFNLNIPTIPPLTFSIMTRISEPDIPPS